jgi:cell division protease FtsH
LAEAAAGAGGARRGGDDTTFEERLEGLTRRLRRIVGSITGSGGRGLFRFLLLTAVAQFVLLGLSVRYLYAPTPTGLQVSLDQLMRAGAAGQIISATFLDEDAQVVGQACSAALSTGGGCPGRVQRYWAEYPRSDAATLDLIHQLKDRAIVTVDPQPLKGVIRWLVQFLLPIVILANLFGIIFLAKSGQGSIGDLVGFGGIGRRRSRRLRLSTGVTFADVAGADEAVAELAEVRDYLLDPRRYRTVGAKPPKGVLLFGPPGCGKTLLARAVAGESGVPFFSMSGSEFVESLVGVGAARVRDLFRKAAQVAPAIIFIDELDAAGRRRGGAGFGGGSDEREQTLNQMLVAMDGFEVSSGIVVIGATNRPDILDPALLRPGRFDRHITVDQPDVEGRTEILGLHAKGKPLAPDVDLDNVARRTAGFTGADLANVVNEAALLSIRESTGTVTRQHFTEAIQRVLHGPRRKGRLMSEAERERLAYHEGGHTLIAAALGRLNEFQRVSIVARGRGLGQSIVAADADKLIQTRADLEDEMAITLGGAAAEQLACGDVSTTAENDLEQATGVARQMIARYGMSPRFGMTRLAARAADVYLGSDLQPAALVSPETLRELDQEVVAVIGAARDRAAGLLEAHREVLDRLADRLIELETIDGEELVGCVAGVLPGPEQAIA